jgi:hypothetical protein
LTPPAAIKRAAIPRAGYEYQDLAGIEVLIRHYRDPDLYAWVMLEADDSAFRALDDVVAARKDGSYEFVQVKLTVDTERYERLGVASRKERAWNIDAGEMGKITRPPRPNGSNSQRGIKDEPHPVQRISEVSQGHADRSRSGF